MKIDERLKAIVVKHSNIDITPESINDKSNLIDDFRFDSVKLVEMIVDIEIEFDVEVGIEKLSMDFARSYLGLRAFILEQIFKQHK